MEAGAAPEGAEMIVVGVPGGLGTDIHDGLHAYIRNLRRLHAAGLSVQHVLVLLRNYAVAAPVHALRAHLVNEDWCKTFDGMVQSYLNELVAHDLDENQLAQASLPLRSGGCGFMSMASRRGAAFLGSWELCFKEVAAAAGILTASDLLRKSPAIAEALASASELVQQQGADDYMPDWAQRIGRPRRQMQKKLGQSIDEAQLETLLSVLPPQDAADVRSAGGSGGAFLCPPMQEDHLIPDLLMKVAIRRRLRVPHPGRVGGIGASHCQHRRRSGDSRGQLCAADLDSQGHHAETCEIGGSTVEKHDKIRNWLAKWLSDTTGRPTKIEQIVARWARQRPDGSIEEARLDVSFIDASGRRAYVDVSIVAASTVDRERQRRRAECDGEAARAMEDTKRLRYPGADLVPFVIETLGRPGESAKSFLRAMAPADPEERSTVLGAAWQSISAIIQVANAEALLTAEGCSI